MKEIRNHKHDENGEIMIEASIILVPTLILIMCMISLSFLFYEQALINTIATEIAVDVAKNYKYSDRAVMGNNTLTEEEMENGKLFSSTFAIWGIEDEYEELGKAYAQRRIAAATLGISSSDLDVSCDIKPTALGRSYVKVVVSHKSNFFLNEIWSLIGEHGVDNVDRFSGVAYAECVDLIGYTSVINFTDYWTSTLQSKLEVLDNADGLIESIKTCFEKGAEFFGF